MIRADPSPAVGLVGLERLVRRFARLWRSLILCYLKDNWALCAVVSKANVELSIHPSNTWIRGSLKAL